MPIHPSFQKILSQFTGRYGDAEGKKRYYMWLNKLNLDDTKPYSNNQLKKEECLKGDGCKHDCAKCLKESFQWAKPLIKLFKQDKEAKYYQVEAHFAVSSMNNNVYTLPEMMDAIHLLPGQHVDLNHNLEWTMKPLEISAAMIEDECAECIIRVPNESVDAKGRDCQACFEDGTYHSVSIEADSDGIIQTSEGNQIVGLKYTGLAVLDEEALPGIPLTTIQPLEKLMVEAFKLVEQLQNESEVKTNMATNQNIEKPKEASAAYCPLCGEKLVDGKCPNKECAAYGKSVQMDEKLAEANEAAAKKDREIAALTEKLVAVQKQSNELHEAKGKLREAENRLDDQAKRLREAEDDNRHLREDIGLLTASRDTAIAGKNEAAAATLRAQTEANKATEAKTKIQIELAELRETTAGSIRREGESAEKLAEATKQILTLETELKNIKEEVQKRDEAIKQMQSGNEKALVEQKRLYKILRENNIYEINPDGSLKISS